MAQLMNAAGESERSLVARFAEVSKHYGATKALKAVDIQVQAQLV